MSRVTKILFFIVCSFAALTSLAQEMGGHKLVVFTDRDFCISGDTLWVKAFVPSDLNSKGNIVHIQIETQNGSWVTSETIRRNDISAEGYITIPDSLQTGLYFIQAFLNAQRSNRNIECIGRSLYVYNRFEEEIEQLPVLDKETYLQPQNIGTTMHIATDKTEYNRREKVQGSISIENNDFEFVVASARITDPFSQANTGHINFEMDGTNPLISPYPENNGVLI
ncbi:MAG TPA: hypothetical protein VEP89_16875, partial [Draconibacterium sp.]|nr:hypothetical protein [Draconibacterium sp.]